MYNINVTALFAMLIAIIGALVALTNIATEVFKKLLPAKFPTDALAIIIAVLLTMVTFFAYFSYAGLPVLWYCVFAAFIIGIMVAYAAMFGFDKLKGIFTSLQNDLK